MSDTTELREVASTTDGNNVIDFSKAKAKLIPVLEAKIQDIDYWYEHLENFGYPDDLAKFFGSSYTELKDE